MLDLDIAAVRQAYEENVRAFGTLEGKIWIISRESALWPKQVSMFAYIPRFLYVQGDVNLLKQPIVSVIGTRCPRWRDENWRIKARPAKGNVASGLALLLMRSPTRACSEGEDDRRDRNSANQTYRLSTKSFSRSSASRAVAASHRRPPRSSLLKTG